MPPRRHRPSFDALESRDVPSGFRWPVETVTYSFAPDGTPAFGPVPSNLQSSFAAEFGGDSWEGVIRRAFATWAAAGAGLSFVEVPDDGASVGALGQAQGDPHFGDIRIFGRNLTDPVTGTLLGQAQFPSLVGTMGGDITLDTDPAYPFSADGSAPGTYSLYEVALHEIGHAIGLEHSQEPAAVMWPVYHEVSGLTSDDVAAVRAEYAIPEPKAAITVAHLRGGRLDRWLREHPRAAAKLHLHDSWSIAKV